MRLAFILLFIAVSVFAQTPTNPIEVCWNETGATEKHCTTIQPGKIVSIIFDTREDGQPSIQPLPDLHVTSLQTFVTSQTYNVPQPDGSTATHSRWPSVRWLLAEAMAKAMAPVSRRFSDPNRTDQQVIQELIAAKLAVVIETKPVE